MKLLCQFCLIMSMTLCTFAIQANTDLIPEKIVLMSTENFGIVYTHELRENQTIYGLSKFFNTDMNLISAANPGVELANVKKSQTVNIPINTEMLISERKLSPNKHYIPVFYTVKAKDNLFRISKVYFNQKIENVMNINNLSNMELSIGQKLLVGWYEYDPVYKNKLAWSTKGIEVDFTESNSTIATRITPNNQPKEKRRQEAQKKNENEPMQFNKIVSTRTIKAEDVIAKEQPIPAVKKEILPVVEKEIKEEIVTIDTPTASPEDVVVEEVKSTQEGETDEEIAEEVKELSNDPFESRNGIFMGEYEDKPTILSKKIRAQWNSKSKDKTNLFALHATAKKGSYIEVYNPMLDRKVIAKVVGNIPDRIYKNNVELIVSPKVAETLGVVDKKFFVTIRFVQE